MIREIFGKPIMTVIKPDEKVIKSPRKKNLVTLTCDCGCGETFEQRPCDAKKNKLHFKNRSHRARWMGIQNKGKKRAARSKPSEPPMETCDVGAVPKTPEPSLDESVKLPIPEEDKDKVNA